MGFRSSVPAAMLAVCGMCLLAVTGPAATASAEASAPAAGAATSLSDTRAVILGLSDQSQATSPDQFALAGTRDLLRALTERLSASPADMQKDAAKFDADLASLRQAVQNNDGAAASRVLKDIIEDAKTLLEDLAQVPPAPRPY
jgi:hypothetical protein